MVLKLPTTHWISGHRVRGKLARRQAIRQQALRNAVLAGRLDSFAARRSLARTCASSSTSKPIPRRALCLLSSRERPAGLPCVRVADARDSPRGSPATLSSCPCCRFRLSPSINLEPKLRAAARNLPAQWQGADLLLGACLPPVALRVRSWRRRTSSSAACLAAEEQRQAGRRGGQRPCHASFVVEQGCERRARRPQQPLNLSCLHAARERRRRL
jgi:hypothetical protein